MKSTSIYLHFDGKCEAAFKLYKEVFQTEILSTLRYRDIPHIEGAPPVQEKDLDRIENTNISIGENTILMGSDVSVTYSQAFTSGNNFSVYLEAESGEEAESVFKGLSENGIVKMPLQLAHWGDLFGMCMDRFGVSWLINFSPKN